MKRSSFISGLRLFQNYLRRIFTSSGRIISLISFFHLRLLFLSESLSVCHVINAWSLRKVDTFRACGKLRRSYYPLAHFRLFQTNLPCHFLVLLDLDLSMMCEFSFSPGCLLDHLIGLSWRSFRYFFTESSKDLIIAEVFKAVELP